MSANTAISVQGVSKAYRIWESPAARLTSPLLDAGASLLPPSLALTQGLRRKAAAQYRDFWALKDISFEVQRGEAVGIIGRNGSGKSTLLQIIAGTLQPTTGSVRVNGRVAALLELGSGFNPEFTGRENVYLYGSVLGLPKTELDARFEAITTFADIGDFIEQPVKTYSSGMLVRLAFAVQTAVTPDILIIDEALAVGDEAFQRKCYARMESLRAAGTTILLVTHATSSILEHCERCLFVHGGHLLAAGIPKPVIQQYHRLIYSSRDKMQHLVAEIAAMKFSTASAQPDDVAATAGRNIPQLQPVGAFFNPALKPQSRLDYTPEGACIENVRILSQDGKQVNHLVRNAVYDYAYEVRFERTCRDIRMAHVFKTVTGVELGGTTLRSTRHSIPLAESGQIAQVRIRFKCLLNGGIYLGNAGVLAIDGERETYLHRIVDAVIFRVLPADESIYSCYVDFEFQPRVILLPPGVPQVETGK